MNRYLLFTNTKSNQKDKIISPFVYQTFDEILTHLVLNPH